ncbi:hypothetical protein CYLTODRAFT_350429 [Cylindrobasidium torrendii FP15055 ss-10]|uniref:Uncharacterized protein n=1 Tax=Cylindrobasidium torrendii FP15055 ss-10 TaxID=1314674 RepID=A0A0D7BFM6_9AGAR|nr:hypothetical protein CYLTODRAFT_350429 [Cylindrobasidium torrendii FP15055 ss-10]
MALVLALFAFLQCMLSVHATLYVVEPRAGATCYGGQECTVTWLDDGATPLLTSYGMAQVGLYTGNQQLVQTIQPLDVSQSLSLTFTPIPEAGPNSDQ